LINQHCGIYAGDEDSYVDFADVFDPLICEYHGLPADFKHTSDMDTTKIVGNINTEIPVHSVRFIEQKGEYFCLLNWEMSKTLGSELGVPSKVLDFPLESQRNNV